MCQIAVFDERLHVSLWLKADLQPPEFDFRLSPNSGHSKARAGLPLLTQAVQKRLLYFLCGGPLGFDDLSQRFFR
jgi:hypothetical protein